MVTFDNIRQFTDVWQEHDPKATQYIPHDDLIPILYKLPLPLGVADVPKKDQRRRVIAVIHALNLRPDEGGMLAFKQGPSWGAMRSGVWFGCRGDVFVTSLHPGEAHLYCFFLFFFFLLLFRSAARSDGDCLRHQAVFEGKGHRVFRDYRYL